MNVAELIAILELLPESEKQKPIMIEVEREIWFNLQSIKYTNPRVVTLSVFPDPFEEALKKAGVS